MGNRGRNAYSFTLCVLSIGTAAGLLVAGTYLVNYLENDYWKLELIPFDEIKGGCELEKAHSFLESVCSGGNNMRKCRKERRYIYHVTVKEPCCGLLASTKAYVSETRTVDLGDEKADSRCWYTTDQAKSEGTVMPCGAPQCMRTSDPADYVDPLKPPSPWSALIAAVLVCLLTCFCCTWPSLFPKLAAKTGVKVHPDDDDSSSSSSSDDSVISGDWDELTPEQHAAAKVLGYDSKKWDNDEDVPANAKPWSELTASEQEAATILGYNASKWDSDAKEEEKEEEDDDDDDGGLFSTPWDDLTSDQRAAARTLGYNKDKWDASEDVPAAGKNWSELSVKEQEAATALGYTESTWKPDEEEETNDIESLEIDDSALKKKDKKKKKKP